MERKYKCENIQCNNEVEHSGFCDECIKIVNSGYSRIVVCEVCSTTLIKELFIEVPKKEQYVYTNGCIYCQKEDK